MKQKKIFAKLLLFTLVTSFCFTNCNSTVSNASKTVEAQLVSNSVTLPSAFSETFAKAGNYTVTYQLEMSDVQPKIPVGRLVARDASSRALLAYRLIDGMDFEDSIRIRHFDVSFETTANDQTVIFELERLVGNDLHITAVNSYHEQVSMDDLWKHNAHFEFQRDDNWSTGTGLYEYEGHTASLVTLDGRWFAFNRRHIQNFTPESLAREAVLVELVVRVSYDQGQTWSAPVTVAKPTAKENDFEGEMIVDSGAFFDAETNTWHILSQCIGMDRTAWGVCHYSKKGSNPMALFVPNQANPVVVDNQLFSRVCDESVKQKSCRGDSVYEGTPQILWKKNGHYYVTFHGGRNLGYAAVDSFRAVVKTRDFVNWVTEGGDLPGDALISAKECNQWGMNWINDTCVGIGSASLLRSGGHNYMLAEAMDMNLVCQQGQNWVLGLVRSPTLGPSGTWESFGNHPFVVSTNPVDTQQGGCQLQYMNLFRDRGRTFMTFAIRDPSTPNYFHYKYKAYELKRRVSPSPYIIYAQ